MITVGQIRMLLQDLESENRLAAAARRAGVDEKAARKYRTLGILRTIWKRVEAQSRLTAKPWFDSSKPNTLADMMPSQRRTSERRVRE